MERKFAVMRIAIDGKDQLLVQEVEIQNDQSLAAARRKVVAAVNEPLKRSGLKENGTLTWVGWVDHWQLFSPITIN